MRQDQFISSQVPIIKSESVIYPAIVEIGAAVLLATKPDSLGARVGEHLEGAAEKLTAWQPRLRPLIATFEGPGNDNSNLIADAYLRILPALSVRAEPKTDIIRVSFSHHDPQVAAHFANSVTKHYIARQVELTNNSSTLAFLQKQRKQYSADLEAATTALSLYSRTNGVYETKEQRELLLRRRSALLATIAQNESDILGRQAQAEEIARQLGRLKLTKISPHISSLANNSAGQRDTKSKLVDTSAAFIDGDPPLLLVRVYQDTVQSLVKINAELSGLRAIVSQQHGQLESLNMELSDLATKEAEFEQLKRQAELERDNVSLLSKKEIEQQLDAALDANNLSRLVVVQNAMIPILPAFPRRLVFAALGVAAGLGAALAVALVASLRQKRRQLVRFASDPSHKTIVATGAGAAE